MVDPFSNQMHWRDQPPSRSPETIPVNLPRSNKSKSAGSTKTLGSSSGNSSTFDPALLNSNLQELDEAVAKLAANRIQLAAALPSPHKARHSRRPRSAVDAAAGTTSIHSGNDNASQCFSEFDQVQFEHDTTKYVFDNMERIAVGVALPSRPKSTSRRSRSSRSSRRNRGHSLERLVSETILREQGQHFSITPDDDLDEVQSSCTTTTSTFDILKDLRKMNHVLASETGTIVGSVHGDIDRNANRCQHSPPAPTPATFVVPKRAPTEPTDDRKPIKSNSIHATNLLPRIDTEDEEPLLLPTAEEWTPDWNATDQLNPLTLRVSPPSANKSGCTDDTDPETINTSVNEKSFQSSQKSFFGEHIAFAEWPTTEGNPSPDAVDDDEWTTFETTNVFSEISNPVNQYLAAKSSTDSFFVPLSLDSPSSIIHWGTQQQPTKTRMLASKYDDEHDGPWSGSQASF